MVTIYCKNISPRFQYVVKLIFTEVLMIDYNIVSNIQVFQTDKAIKINYSDDAIEGSIQIKPSGLMDEHKVAQKFIKPGTWNNIPVLFSTDNSPIPFDIFSAVFYMVSRYEEYLQFMPDKHGRFEAEESIAANRKFLHLPVVDLWCKMLAEVLQIYQQCKGLQPGNYRFKLTVDIDRAWKYKNAGITHTLIVLGKNLVLLKSKQIIEQIKVLLGKKSDPYDCYEYLYQIQEQLREKITFFILCGRLSTHDHNIPIRKKHFKQLITQLSNKSEIGLHPSYRSNNSIEILQSELTKLENVAEEKIYHSRQHFLKVSFPATYRRLIKLGILHEYSMGYSHLSGFRAGIARPYFFYDLSTEKPTDLRITPFQVMDRTLLGYMKLTPNEAIKEIEYYKKTISNVGGQFVALWHNSSLYNEDEWTGWKEVFEKLISLHQKNDKVPSA